MSTSRPAGGQDIRDDVDEVPVEMRVAGLIVMGYVHAQRGRRFALEQTVGALVALGSGAVREQLDAMAERLGGASGFTLDPGTAPLTAYRAGLVFAGHRLGDMTARDALVEQLPRRELCELMAVMALLAASAERHPPLAGRG